MSGKLSKFDQELQRRWLEFKTKNPDATAQEIRAFGLSTLLAEALDRSDRDAFWRWVRVSQQEDKLAKKQTEAEEEEMTPEERERRIHEILGM